MKWISMLICWSLSSAALAAKEPRFTSESGKSLDDLAGCIALQVAESRGYELQKIATPAGVTLKMKFRVGGIAATAATFEIEDLGDRRRMRIFATGKANGAPRTIAGHALAECAPTSQ
jgi:hypothetical protein